MSATAPRSPEILILDDPAARTAELLMDHARAGHHIALTGGSTPRDAYERAAADSQPGDWSKATLWFGDERCVGPDDERSNYGMARAALLERLTGEPPTVHRMPGDLGPQAGADAYETQLHETFGQGIASLDLVLLGLGPDGHVASLFPHQATLDETDRLVVGVEQAGFEPYVPRISLTLPVIDAGAEVVFLVAGGGKSAAVARAFGGAADPATPASLVTPASGSLTVLLDPAAAADLEG